MSLQVRLRHPLGEQWIDLPERGVEHPVVVGRAATSDVQVPSAAVGHKHCVLFVHGGRWVVQDVAPGGGGTFVNGARVGGAAYLNVGDAITLGPDAAAPSLEIDPVGAAQGRAGQPVAAGLPPATDRLALTEMPAEGPYATGSYGTPAHVDPHPANPAAYPGYPAYPGA